MLLTIDFLSRLNVVHCDVKPQNLLLNMNGNSSKRGPKHLIAGDLTLVDFSYSTNIKDQKPETEAKDGTALQSKSAKIKRTLSTVNGTPGYIPPEFLQDQSCLMQENSDVFSVGIVLFECLTFVNMWTGETIEEVFEMNAAAPTSHVEREIKKRCRFSNSTLINFISSLLEPSHQVRPTARMALNHKWFRADDLLFKGISKCLLWNEFVTSEN